MILPFDKCYILHLTEAVDRYENIIEQFNKYNIENYEIWWSTDRPLSSQIGDSIRSLHSIKYDKFRKYCETLYGSVYNVSLEFYTIIKQAYLRGFENILLMEDDIRFKDDFDYETFFSNLPEDWDILRLGYSKIHERVMRSRNVVSEDSDFLINTKFPFGGMCMVAFNRRAMEYYINYMDSKFEYADSPLIYMYGPENEKYHPNGELLKSYVAKESIVDVDNMNSVIEKNIFYVKR